MKTRFIPALVTLIAAACVSIVNIIKKTEPGLGLEILLVTIIVFYIVGLIAKAIINKTIAKNDESEDIADESTEELKTQETEETNDNADKMVE